MSQAMGSLMRVAVLAGVLAFSSGATAQTAPPQAASPPAENAAPTADNAVMLTHLPTGMQQSLPIGVQ